MDEAEKKELIAWSKRGNILTRWTAFVGISEKQNQVSFMTNSSVHGGIVKADLIYNQINLEVRLNRYTRVAAETRFHRPEGPESSIFPGKKTAGS